MAKLHITSPGSLAKTVDLTNNLLTIGRTGDNDIHIHDHSISKRHGILVRDGDDYQLHDFNSTNGTFVNGERIMAVKLQHGVSIRFGSVEVRYESAPASTSVAPLEAKPMESMLAAKGKERGMSKRTKPDFAAGKLESGPVTFHPKISAKPIPPMTSASDDS